MAIWISKFLGPVILALAIPMLVTPKSFGETARRFLADRVGGVMMDRPTMTRVVGAFWAFLGALLTFKGYA